LPKKIRKERLEFTIERVKKNIWEYYKKYHYLNESIGAGHYYELKLNNKKVGFISIARFPHPIAKDIMTIGRLVIVPEFQGFNLGIRFMNTIADLYRGNRIRITTSLKSFMIALNKNDNWKCVRNGRVHCSTGKGFQNKNKKNSSVSINRITATFQYKT
jgi:hypothetical protein